MREDIPVIIEKELGEEPAHVEQIGEGLMHETYAVIVEETEYILQLAGDKKDSRVLNRCLNCYQLLRDSPVPVPHPITEQPGTFNGRTYTIVEKLPGQSAKLAITPEKTRKAAAYLAEIHNVRTFPHTGHIDFDENTVHREEEGLNQQRLAGLHEKIGTYRNNGMTDLAEALTQFLNQYANHYPEQFQPVLCHDDYSPDNVIFHNGKVTGIIDFDFAYAGHDQRDLVKAANSFWMHNPTADWNVRKTFYNGYRAHRELNDKFTANEALYRVDTLTGLIASMIELDELTEDEQTFYKERIHAAITRGKDILANHQPAT